MTSKIAIKFIDLMLHSKFGPNRTSSFLQEAIRMKMADLEVQLSTVPLEKADPDGEHNLKTYHCPYASYKK